MLAAEEELGVVLNREVGFGEDARELTLDCRALLLREGDLHHCAAHLEDHLFTRIRLMGLEVWQWLWGHLHEAILVVEVLQGVLPAPARLQEELEVACTELAQCMLRVQLHSLDDLSTVWLSSDDRYRGGTPIASRWLSSAQRTMSYTSSKHVSATGSPPVMTMHTSYALEKKLSHEVNVLSQAYCEKEGYSSTTMRAAAMRAAAGTCSLRAPSAMRSVMFLASCMPAILTCHRRSQLNAEAPRCDGSRTGRFICFASSAI